MYGHSGLGRGTRPKKISGKNISTVNLGLPYNVQENTNVDTSSNQSFQNTNMVASAHNLMKIVNSRWKDQAHLQSPNPISENYLFSPKSNKQHPGNSIMTSPTNQMLSKAFQTNEVMFDSKQLGKNLDRVSKIPKAHAGERVIFAESPSAPGIPIVYRLDEERKSNPDKLNLDRHKLSVCPMLEGEENLRLLNLQHNSIRKIQHLMFLKKLIFLDLYDNQLDEISGLASLKCLRVLMLGKNKIRKISNLQDLTLLDVLDLHGNKISKVENLSHLHQLRVLNLAGNELTIVKNLSGLTSLSELNLRRNQINTLLDLDTLPSLQRLFLSFNNIKSFDDISCLNGSSSLVDLCLDGNPLCNHTNFKQIILQSVTSLRLLDMKRITEEEKRIAQVIARKEDEKKKESERLSSIKEKRRLAISNAQRQWDRQCDGNSRIQKSETNESIRDMPHPKLKVDVREYSSCHLAELDGNVLNLYGPRSLDAINKNWGDKTANTVETISFKFINFSEVVPRLNMIRNRFPSLQTLQFENTNIYSLNDINALGSINQLDNLVISEGNSVTELINWRPYTIQRLKSLNLKSINNVEISESNVDEAEIMFGKLTRIATRDHFTNKLESRPTSSSMVEDKYNKLHYCTNSNTNTIENEEMDAFSLNYVREIIQDSILVDRRLSYFEKMWPQLLEEMVSKYTTDMVDLNEYGKLSLDAIKNAC